MGEAAAVPQNLYNYADKTTGAARDLKGWITGVLSPAISSYQAGAKDFGNDISNLTVARWGPSGGAVDGEALNNLGTIAATDAEVKAVGKAFEVAGGGGGAQVFNQGLLPSRGYVVTTDDRINQTRELADVYDKYFGAIPPMSSQTTTWVRPLGGNHGVILGRFFIPYETGAFGVLEGDKRSFSANVNAPYRIAFAWDTATGKITYTVTPSTEIIPGHMVGKQYIPPSTKTIPAKDIDDGFWKNKVKVYLDNNGSLQVRYKGINSKMPVFAVNGDIGIKLNDSGGSQVKLEGDAYPNFELLQYRAGHPPQFLAQSKTRENAGNAIEPGLNSTPHWPAGQRQEAWDNGKRVPFDGSPVETPNTHIWREPGPPPQRTVS